MIPQQQSHHVGDVVVTRIPELLLRDFRTTDLIPQWDEAAVAQHVGWMVPDCLDPAHGHVVVSTHSWLVRTPRHTIIVDTAVGNAKPRAVKEFDNLHEPWLERLAAAGTTPETVDFVLLTHLHTDHVGWNTRRVDGRWRPTFPNARYIVAQGEQERLASLLEQQGPGTPKTAFYADSVLPVIEAGQLSYVSPASAEPVQGFVFHPTPGHSSDHMSIGLRSGNAYGFFAGDVMHHPIQVTRPDWSSVFSESPEQGRRSREWALGHMADTRALVFSSQFPGSSAGRVIRSTSGYDWTFV